MKKTAEQKKSRPKKTAAATKKRPAHTHGRLPISTLRLKRLAFSCEHMAEADQVGGLKRPLADIIASHDKLAAAWDRGQLLRNLEGCAAAIMTVTQAAKLLGFESGAKLRELLDTDAEVRDLWEQKRIGTVYQAKAALAEAAKEGNQAAIRAVEVFLRDEGEIPPAGRVDYTRLGTNQLAELFGCARQTVFEWYTKHGLARNTDGTFDLKTAIAWFEQYTLKKASKGKEILAQSDPLRAIRAQTLALELDRRRGQLLEREPVIAGQVARFKNLVDGLGKLTREVAPMLVNQTVERIKEIISSWAGTIIVAQRQIPDELELGPDAAEALARVYQSLNNEQATEDTEDTEDTEKSG
jgi:hypothetical protein